MALFDFGVFAGAWDMCPVKPISIGRASSKTSVRHKNIRRLSKCSCKETTGREHVTGTAFWALEIQRSYFGARLLAPLSADGLATCTVRRCRVSEALVERGRALDAVRGDGTVQRG